MKKLNEMSRDEKSLLLFFECRSVDYSGRVKTAHMNAIDFAIADKWNNEGFIQWGRICHENLSEHGSHWCYLSGEAWVLAAEERKARAARLWEQRKWKTTNEKREE